MTATKVMPMLLVILAFAGWSNVSVFATPITLTIDYGGACPPPVPVTGDPAIMTIVPAGAGSQKICGNYVIKPKNTSIPVTLETGLDSNNDTLILKNMKITKAPGAWPDLHITIKGANKYQTIPSAIPGGPSVGYRVSAFGFFKRGITNLLALNSYLKTRGFQKNPTGTGTLFWLGFTPPTPSGIELNWTVCGTAGCSNFLPASYEAHSVWTANLAATRDLSAEFWVKLNDNTDALNLTELSVLHYMPGEGEGPAEVPDEAIPPGCPPEQCVHCEKKPKQCEHEPDK